MKAIVFPRTGDAEEVLDLTDRAEAELGPGGVRVRVTARPLPGADWFFIRGQCHIVPVRRETAGLEGVGIVLETADPTFTRGARVAFRWPGTWAESVTVPSSRLIRVPDDIGDDIACQISLNPITAWALLEEAHVLQGDRGLLTAGTSTIAALVARLARERGVRSISVVRAPAATPVRPSPADLTLSTEDPYLLSGVAGAAGDAGVAAFLDGVGGPTASYLFSAL